MSIAPNTAARPNWATVPVRLDPAASDRRQTIEMVEDGEMVTYKVDRRGAVVHRKLDQSGIPVSTQDAYQLVKARRVMAQQQARAAQEQRARQQSARRVGRAVSGGNPSNGEVPPEVMKQGAPAIIQWLQANTEAARKFSQQR